MCIPTSLWRPAALLAMQQFRVYRDEAGEPQLRSSESGSVGKSLLAFLTELECLTVYLEMAKLSTEKRQLVYAQVCSWGVKNK
jgi:hypothetical protein